MVNIIMRMLSILNQNENIYKKVNRKVLVKSIIVGFLGGIFYSLFLLVLNYFKLIEINILSSIGKSLINNDRSEEHTSELQSRGHLVCRLLLEKKKQIE